MNSACINYLINQNNELLISVLVPDAYQFGVYHIFVTTTKRENTGDKF